jgi:hypothetical protein
MNNSDIKKGGVYKMKSVGNREMCVKYAISITVATERRVLFKDGNNSDNC